MEPWRLLAFQELYVVKVMRGLKSENRAFGNNSKKFTMMEYDVCGKEL